MRKTNPIIKISGNIIAQVPDKESVRSPRRRTDEGLLCGSYHHELWYFPNPSSTTLFFLDAPDLIRPTFSKAAMLPG